MTWHRAAIASWQDASGATTAVVIGDRDGVAVARSFKAARAQLRAYLVAFLKENDWIPATELDEPWVQRFRIPLRPEYRTRETVMPCPETVHLEVDCVLGRDPQGMLLGEVPRLGIRFYARDEREVPELVKRYVQEQLRGAEPARLGSEIPLGETRVDVIAVRAAKARPATGQDEVPRDLGSVAEPLTGRGMRRRFAAPHGRADQVSRLVELLGEKQGGVLLVGEPGCGKTTILVEAGRQLERARKETSRSLFWMTSGPRLVAGLKYLGQWQARLERVLEQVGARGGFLCVEGLAELLAAGGREPGSSVGAFLVPYLKEGELNLVVEASPAELDRARVLLPSLTERLRIVRVPPLGEAPATEALAALADRAERDLGVVTAPGAVAEAVRLHRRFMPYDALPGKAAGFVRGLLEETARKDPPSLDAEVVRARFVARTGLPDLLVRDDVPVSAEELEAHLLSEVVGQDQAVRRVARRVTLFKAGLEDPTRPLGVFLFCGPTGVGKTQLARSLADLCFGAAGENRLLRLDMSEYAGPGAASRLLQQPDGRPGKLIQALRAQPFQVVLLDEIEKAAPEVFDLLLTVLDEGRLTDTQGRVATFRSSFLVMTSNLGSGVSEPMGFEAGRTAGGYLKAVRDFFRPEMVNRFDEVLAFHPLSAEVIRTLARRELDALAAREGLASRQLTLTWDEALEEKVAAVGFDPRYGARPLQRAVERLAGRPVARWLAERPKAREAALHLGLDGDEVVLLEG